MTNSMVVRRARAVLAGLGIATLGIAPPASAQWGVWYADSLLAEGRIAHAEAAYYAASRARPRDPVARTALGRYLAARSATRVGAVLLEEAMRFGADSMQTAALLVPLYERLGDYAAIRALRPDVLTDAERRRAEWLGDRPRDARLRDSVVVITYRPIGDGRGVGTVMLRVGNAELPAIIDTRSSGLTLPATVRRSTQTFGRGGARELAAVAEARVGPVTFFNLPAVVGSADEQVRIGFDILAPYSPSFDPRAGTLTLRRVPRGARPHPGPRIPALYDINGLRLLLAGRWQPSTSAMPAMLLATRAWMWDDRRGDVVLLP